MTFPSLLTRQHRMDASPSPYATPGRPRLSRGLSPPHSYPSGSTFSTPTVTSRNVKPPNIVSRVAIEGRARQAEDKVSVNMFLKLSIPLDQDAGISSSIPLFPEESVRLVSYQVHPLDSNSTPYNFSSKLLRRAARALNLSTRSPDTFYAACEIDSPHGGTSATYSTTRASSPSPDYIPLVDEKYTGYISVSQYHISYVPPKTFPMRHGIPDPSKLAKSRRTSVGEKNAAHFMAAIELQIPYLTKPSKNPYLVSIPTPRCLHNQIRFTIFPNSTAASFASLSSQEGETGSWDLATDPQITRSSTTRSRSGSYSHHFADDESSDSSMQNGSTDGPTICGSFPSAERLRIRWAKPPSPINRIAVQHADGLARANVNKVNATMNCTIKGTMIDPVTNTEGVLMQLQYKAECSDVSFPGVATILGLDAYLEAKGSDVSWVSESTWDVSGSNGFVGFNCGPSLRNGIAASRQSSLDSSLSSVNIGSASSSSQTDVNGIGISRHSSQTSLLRAPLPTQSVPEYSFEGSSSVLGGAVSSLSSSQFPSQHHLTQSLPHPPKENITLQLNVNDLLPPAPNVFVFTITGTVLLTPQSSLRGLATKQQSRRYGLASGGTSGNDSQDETSPIDPITLPHFTLHSSQHEVTNFILRNDSNSGVEVEILDSRFASRQATGIQQKTVLQNGTSVYNTTDTSCRVIVRQAQAPSSAEGSLSNRPTRHLSFPTSLAPTNSTPTNVSDASNRSGHQNAPSRGPSPRPTLVKTMAMAASLRPKRDGPLMIPSVDAVIIPLGRSSRNFKPKETPEAYSVRITMPAPSDSESEWLEFGLAPRTDEHFVPKVQVASASLEGVPVKFESFALERSSRNSQLQLPGAGEKGGDRRTLGDNKVLFGEMSGKDWECWVRVRIGGMGGGTVVVDYVVHLDGNSHATAANEKEGRQKRSGPPTRLDVFLPTFAIPVGRLSVEVQVMEKSGLELSALETNLRHQQLSTAGPKLLQYSLDPFFCPSISLSMSGHSKPRSSPSFLIYLGWFTSVLCFLLLCLYTVKLGAEVRFIRQQVTEYVLPVSNRAWIDDVPVMTSSDTLHTDRWQLGDTADESLSVTSSTGGSHVSGSDGLEDRRSPEVLKDEFLHESLQGDKTSDLNDVMVLYPGHPSSPSLTAVLESLIRTTWWVLKMIYHYPLDPS